MAPYVTNHHFPGRIGRVFHRPFPSRTRAIAELAIELAALHFELPVIVHVVVAVVAQFAGRPGRSRDRPVTRACFGSGGTQMMLVVCHTGGAY